MRKNVTEVSCPPVAYQRNILEISVHLSEAWRTGCASCRILGMLGSIGLHVTTKGTLWSDFGLALSARPSSLVTNEAFSIASLGSDHLILSLEKLDNNFISNFWEQTSVPNNLFLYIIFIQ